MNRLACDELSPHTHTHTHTHTSLTHTHTRTHTHARAHTHTHSLQYDDMDGAPGKVCYSGADYASL